FFAGLDAPVSGDLARYEAVTIVMGALTTCALTYLLAERVLRPVTALALAGNPPKQPVGPGVKGRLVLAWVTASGVPLVGLALVGVDVATRSDLTHSRIASSILVLSALAIAVGLAATIMAAKRPPEEVVSLLNRFFGVVVEVVGAHGGWINKFEGDGALCVFGAPVEQPDAAAAALAASRVLHARLVHELPEVDAGIGVSA